MFVDNPPVIPTSEQCSNGNGITAEYNATVEYGVSNVRYNVTAVGTSTTQSQSTRQFKVANTVLFGILILVLATCIVH